MKLLTKTLTKTLWNLLEQRKNITKKKGKRTISVCPDEHPSK